MTHGFSSPASSYNNNSRDGSQKEIRHKLTSSEQTQESPGCFSLVLPDTYLVPACPLLVLLFRGESQVMPTPSEGVSCSL